MNPIEERYFGGRETGRAAHFSADDSRKSRNRTHEREREREREMESQRDSLVDKGR